MLDDNDNRMDGRRNIAERFKANQQATRFMGCTLRLTN